ncbi:MAG: hypothetical protein DSZ05_02040, partial [Sulfurospirillum sp.]
MLIVQKYGGTSVGDLERIENVAKRVARTKKEGNDLIVVVSAMSGETNKLIEYAHHFSKNPSPREMDLLLSAGERVTSALLAIALKEMGHDAIALTGRQAGIYTDDVHTSARIDKIDTSVMQEHIGERFYLIPTFESEGGFVTLYAPYSGKVFFSLFLGNNRFRYFQILKIKTDRPQSLHRQIKTASASHAVSFRCR